MQPYEQLARYGVSAAELLGSVGAHVPAGDRRGEAQQLLEVLAQRHMTTNVDERKRRDLVVDDYRRARISAKVPALDGVAPGREHQILAVEHEPHRHHIRLAAWPAA